jgi:molybdate transport system substrate-binding protein
MPIWKFFGAAGALAFTAAFAVPALAQDSRVTVFAAASLKNALDAVNEACAADVGETATISYAASSALAKQIEAGAPADVFMSADLDWMTYLSERNLTTKGTEVALLGNSIVLVAPADSTVSLEIGPNFEYGKAALEKLGIWASVEAKTAQAENVRAALALVATGEAPLGIVYKTDADAEPEVKVVDVFPAGSHPAIVYPVAQTAQSEDDDTPAFLKCLQSAKAKALFEGQGFTLLVPPASN